MTTIYVSLSEKHKSGKKKAKKDNNNPRSKFLSVLMREIGADSSLIDAFSGKSRVAFEEEMDTLKVKMANKMPNSEKKSKKKEQPHEN